MQNRLSISAATPFLSHSYRYWWDCAWRISLLRVGSAGDNDGIFSTGRSPSSASCRTK
jgi:hypothetical protein